MQRIRSVVDRHLVFLSVQNKTPFCDPVGNTSKTRPQISVISGVVFDRIVSEHDILQIVVPVDHEP